MDWLGLDREAQQTDRRQLVRYRPSPADDTPAPDPLVDHFAAIAGDGDLDDRCRRILDVYRDEWFSPPRQDP